MYKDIFGKTTDEHSSNGQHHDFDRQTRDRMIKAGQYKDMSGKQLHAELAEKKKKVAKKFPGYRHMSGAQRYNARLHHTFEEAKRLNAIHDAGRKKHSEEKHGGEYSSCKTCFKD